jgi:hypothetical protein
VAVMLLNDVGIDGILVNVLTQGRSEDQVR